MPDGDLARTGLMEMLLRRMRRSGGRGTAILFETRRGQPVSWDDATLVAEVGRMAEGLRRVARPGDRALIALPTGPDYVASLLACFATGVIAVPAFPMPGSTRRQERTRLEAMVADCTPAIAIVRGEGALPGGVRQVDPALLRETAGGFVFVEPAAEDIAFLQYTSGSTSLPKGVIVTHGNLVANLRTIQPMIGAEEASVMVSWLPLYHDMGLIGGLLSPLYAGGRVVLASSLEFAERPRRWLELVATHRGTITVAPNFAYQLCLDRIDEAQCAGLDLSSLRVMISGAEPIRPAVMDAFASRFASTGLKRAAIRYFYGLAEATLMVSGTAPEDTAEARETAAGRSLADCGPAAPGCRIEIVDPATGRSCAPGAVGEIWVAGESISPGYWQREALSQETMQVRLGERPERWLRTGDLGFLSKGHLFVTGRTKDLIILRGRNIAPQDVEESVEGAVAGLRPGRVAAFPVAGAAGEGIGIAAELARGQTGAPDGVIRALRLAVAEAFEEAPVLVLLLPPGLLPRTTSGKLRRSACLPLWQEGALAPIALHDGRGEIAPAASAQDTRTAQIAGLWAELLGRKPAPDEDFFLAGGHSLHAASLAARIEAVFGWTPPMAFAFTARTPAAQAAAITAALAQGEGRVAPERQAAGQLSALQRALWLEYQLAPEDRANLVGGQVEITGRLDTPRLRAALVALARRHPVLHARLVADRDASPIWQPMEEPGLDLAEQDSAEPEADIARFMARPFMLEAAPPFRALLLHQGPQRHVLALAFHHIAVDGQSAAFLLDELGLCYDGLAASLPPVPQAALPLQPQAGDAAYWRDRLTGLPPLLPLATDRPRQTPHDGQTWRATRNLPPALGAALGQAARRAGATQAALGLALFAALLHRLSGGARDVAIALPVSLRPVSAARNLGSFMNTVVVRLAPRAEESLAALLAEVAQCLPEALTHAGLPFAEVVAEVAPLRDGLHPPLARALFNHRAEAPGERRGFTGLTLGPIADIAGGSASDITLEWVERPAGLSFNLDLATDIFDSATADRLADALLRLAEGLGSGGAMPLAATLPLQASLPRALPGLQPLFPAAAIRARVERHPGLEAVFCDGASLSYARLDSLADGIARRLVAAGIGSEQVVGLALSRSAALPAALLGIWRAGAAFLPLDTDYPADRLAFMLRDAGANLVLADRQVVLPEDLSAEIILLQEIAPAAPCETWAPHPEQLAYVMYTSGSTGRPKGVAISHGALARHLADFIATHGIDERDTVLQSSTVNFDVFLHEMLPALMMGGRVVMRGPAPWSFERLNETLRREAVTVARVPTSLWQEWLDHLPESLPRLRLVTVGGEALAGDAVAKWRASPFGAVPLANLYGPTETTIACLYRVVSAADTAEAIAPIGQCYAHRTASIRDQDGNPVWPGGTGDLCIGGATLARGYLGRAGLTAECFLPDPDGLPGSRLYRTGDLARWRGDGAVGFLGRADSQIKLRGIRVEPAEIESAMRSLAGVRDAIVLLSAEGPAARLVGYAAGAVTEEALARHLASRLPGAMVPGAFVVLPTFPTMPNGKTDRAALPPPPAASAAVHAEPQSHREAVLLALWREVLAAPSLGVTDDFFAAGGDSILSLRIVARARAAGLDLTPRQIFEAPTVARLAPLVRERAAQVPAPVASTELSLAVPGIDPELIETAVPATPLQRGLLLLATQSAADPYHVQHVFELAGPLDPAALKAAWQAAVARHAILRAGFSWMAADEPVLMIHRDATRSLVERDWRHLSTHAQAEALAEDWRAARARGFDFARPGPDLTLICLAEGRHWLVWRMHHAQLDGWSLALILEEVALGLADTAPAPSFTLYAAWQAARETETRLTRWRKRLISLESATPLPVSDGQADASLPFAEQVRPLEPAMARALGLAAARMGVTFGTMLQAAWGQLLAYHTGSREVLFGLTLSGRPESLDDVERIAGLFINTLPLRLCFDPARALAETLAAVQAEATALWDDADLPGHALQAASPLPPGQPLFESILVLENYPIGDGLTAPQDGVVWSHVTPDRGADGIRHHHGRNHYPLSLIVQPQGEGWQLALSYATGRFDHATADRLLAQMAGILEAMAAADPAQPWGRRALALPAPAPRTMPDQSATALLARIAARAAAAPERVALATPQSTLTWQALWESSGRLAARLAAEGIAAEDAVALCLPRTPGFVVALLAVWRAGGVILPLDPAQPEARLATILAASGARLLLVDAPAPWADGVRCLGLDAASSGPAPLCLPLPDQAAYIIHTSGSTGTPKGVVVSHAAMEGYLAALDGLLPEGITRAAWTSAPAADLGHSVLLGALAHGWQLFIPDEADLFDGARFAAMMAQARPDFIKLVPSHLQAVLEGAEALPGRCLMLGGEAAPASLLARLRGLAPGLTLINHYGPTEATVGILAGVIPTEMGNAPLGRPLAHAAVTLRDADGNPLPPGLPGEICAGGTAVARGYLARPGQTAERFLPDENGPPGSRLYRTGDRAVQGMDGAFRFLGRTDQQVKINGYRIELAEVEAALLRVPGMRAAAAALRLDEAGRPRLHAWVVGEVALASLRALLAAQLPGPMLPQSIWRLKALPLTPNGKLDRAALVPAEPDQAEPEASNSARREATEREVILRDIWEAVLRRSPIGLDEDFFALGGDSIGGLQLVSRAREHGLHLSPRDVFMHPTIAALARVAKAGRAVSRRHEVTGVDLPLTPIQHRFFARHPHGEAHWNQAVLLHLAKALPAERIEAALRVLVVRHDALRLRFAPGAAGWRQTLAEPPGGIAWAFADLRESAAGFAALAEACQQGMDLARGRLLSALYALLPDGEARLLIAIHHLAVDGVSWRILLAELRELLRGAALPPLTGTSWSRWTQALAVHADSGIAEREVAWWQAALAGSDDRLPLGESVAGLSMGASREAVVAFDPETTAALLTRMVAAWSIRPEEVLAATLAQTLSAWRGLPGALIEMEGHGREDCVADTDLSATLGWFTTRYPVWLPIAAEAPIEEALVLAKEVLRAVPARGFHYGLSIASRSGPRPRVSFNYLGRFDSGGAEDGWRLLREELGATVSPRGRMAYALDINALVLDGRLSVSFRYSPAALAPDAAAALVEDFGHRLRQSLRLALERPARRSAADFPLSGLDQTGLAALGLDLHEVADLYPATPLQAGLLLHAGLEEGSAPAAYVGQLYARLPARTDIASLREAWRHVLARHAALRTGFLLRPGSLPLQVVRHAPDLPFRVLDWREDPGDHEARLAAWRQADLQCGFDIAAAPLMRLALIRRPDGRLDMIWTHHHALTDGWSNARLIGEVAAAYAALGQGAAPALPAVVPYRDYVVWAQAQAKPETWWRGQIDGMEGAARLLDGPAGRDARLASPGSGMAASGQSLASLMPGLRRAAKRHRVSLATLFQAAWAIVLTRLTGRRRVIFGITLSGRPHDLPGAEAMVGLFINSLPLMLDLPGALETRAFLARVQAAQGDIAAHAAMPLADLQRLAGMPGRPLFDSLLIVENYPLDEAGQGPLAPERVEVTERTHYPLTLTVLPGADPRIAWSWNEAVLNAQTLAEIQADYANILDSLCAEPPSCLGTLVLPQARIPAQPAPSYAAILPRIAAVPAERIAVRNGGVTLSYGALRRQADGLAARLGMATEERIGLCVGRHAGMVAGLLGILAAGGAYVPMDPAYPAARLLQMLEDAGIARVVADAAGAAALAAHVAGLEIIRLEESAAGEADPGWGASPADQLAYVIYTSGSTGRPKGVAIPHAALARTLDAMAALVPVSATDRWLSVTSLSFDIAALELFLPLMQGAEILLAAREEVVDGTALAALIAAQRPTVMQATPSGWKLLLAGGWQGQEGLRGLCGGEALAVDLAEALAARGVALTNVYGPTETTIWSTGGAVDAAMCAGVAQARIGTPLAGESLAVIGEEGMPAPPGGVGELCIGGIGVARGYFGQPGLTAAHFVPDREGTPGSRLYRTGDLVRAEASGIAFLGRMDGQVKLRGHRIELGEVEAALRALPGVADAVAVVREGQLLAYVTPEQEVAGLATGLAGRLPPPMRPSLILALPAFPQTPNGKLDRARLPAPQRRAARGPETEAERLLLQTVSEVLRIPLPDRQENFFQAGGDSILALGLVTRLREAGLSLSVRQIFETPCLADLAAQAVPYVASVAEARILPDDLPEGAEDAYPATAVQQGMVYHGLRRPGLGLYIGQLHLRLGPDVDAGLLRRSFDLITRRHAALRTAFALRPEGAVRQVVYQAAAMPFLELDWRHEGDGYARILEEWRTEDRRQGFDVGAAPLLRATLIRRPDGGHDLVWTSHHALLDGWSQSRLLGELSLAYAAFRAGGVPSLAPVRPYRDYIEWLSGQDTVAAEACWRNLLAGSQPALFCPTLGLPRGEAEPLEACHAREMLALETSERLRAAARAHGLTLGTVLQGAWALLLARYAGRRHVVFGVTVSGRPAELPGVESMLGLFINSLPLVAAVPAEAALWHWLAGLQRLSGTLRQYEHTPLTDIQRWAGRSGDALFDSLLVFENYPVDAAARGVSGDLAPQAVRQLERTHYPLTLMIDDGEDGLALRWLWDGEKIARRSVEALRRDYATILAWIAEADRSLHGGPALGRLALPQARVAFDVTRLPEALLAQLGRPLAGEGLAVLGEDGLPAPVGGVGELCIAGSGMARGYPGRPGLTAERLVPDAEGPAGSRLYRTGDLVRVEAEGIAFLGRMDAEVTLRGHRIELGEVEAALRAVPGIREATALIQKERLVAWIVGSASPEQARSALMRRLPPPMVPSAIRVLDHLPLTPNGKLDRARLTLPDRAPPRGTPPADTVEAAICAAFAQVTRTPEVWREDEFFALGGDSLGIMTVSAKLSEALGRPVTVADLFAHPTPAALAARLAATRPSPAADLDTLFDGLA